MKEDKQPLLFNFRATSPTNDTDHQLITQNDAEMARNTDSFYNTPEVMPGPTTSIMKPFIESKICKSYLPCLIIVVLSLASLRVNYQEYKQLILEIYKLHLYHLGSGYSFW